MTEYVPAELPSPTVAETEETAHVIPEPVGMPNLEGMVVTSPVTACHEATKTQDPALHATVARPAGLCMR